MPVVVVGISLLALLTALVAYAWTLVGRSHSSGVVSWITKIVHIAGSILSYLPGGSLGQSLFDHVAHYIGSLFLATVKPVVSFFSGLKQHNALLYANSFGWPLALYKAASWLYHTVIPTHIRASTAPIAKQAHAAAVVNREQGKAIAHTGATVRPIAHAAARSAVGTVAQPFASQWEWIKAHWRRITSAAALAGVAGLAGTMPYGFTIRGIRRRLSRLEKISLGGLAAGALIAGLARVGLGWVRCQNVGRVGRALCRTPGNLLNDLLGILADIWVLENVCTLIGPLETAAETIGTPLVEALTVVGAGICAGSIGQPAPLLGAAVTVPALYVTTPLAV